MANKSVFAATKGKLLPRPDSRNRENALAYAYEPRHALAQLAVTGCINQTYYAEAREQPEEILRLAREVDPVFLAKTAIYARERGYMKDMPALLAAVLTVTAPELAGPTFRRVIDNGKMLRNYVQILRSGAVGRKSLGTAPKRLVQTWLNEASDRALITALVGQSPSLADVIKMVHPKPTDQARAAFYGYAVGKPHDLSALPTALRDYERFKCDPSLPVPAVPFQMLTALDLSPRHWREIARTAGWQMTRMNLNTFLRHGVFDEPGMSQMIARRLASKKLVKQAQAFPYQLMAAHTHAARELPGSVRKALNDAMEVAIGNVPRIKGRVVVCPDVSGSMSWQVTGRRKGASTAVRCIDVAALVAAAMLRMNRDARVLPFDYNVARIDLDPRAGVLKNADRLAKIGGGGTNCSAPITKLNMERANVDLVILVSDNQSWLDVQRGEDTGLMREWSRLKARNRKAKLVCLDIAPYGTTQAAERKDILNVGGFSDAVFDVIADFAQDRLDGDHWVEQIEKTELVEKE